MEKISPCDFCTKRPFGHLARFGLPECLLYFPVSETDNLMVKPDILPVNFGHFLIYPKRHSFNFANYPDPMELGGVIYQLTQRFGPLALFEHGGVEDGANHQSVYHAHIHAITQVDGKDIISWMEYMLSGGLGPEERYSFQVIEVPYSNLGLNLPTIISGKTPYFYVQHGGRALYLEDSANNIRSQLTQRAMHLLFSGQILNWKQIPVSEETARLSAQRLAAIRDICLKDQF